MIDKYKYTGERFFSFQTSSAISSPISKEESKALLKENVKRIAKIQDRLFAEKKLAFLFVFQAMDAAGKDGTIRKVFSGINPQGIEVTSFRKPTEEELQHDFLWRVNKKIPRKGMIGIFNRSHYEEVLVARVHPQFLLYQNLPNIKSVDDADESFWENRYESIVAFEQQLAESGVVVVKFFLNVSFDEQEKRLLERINNPNKNWKFKLGDFEQRAHWQAYRHCFQDMINGTATQQAPWYVIPADDKNTMRALVSSKVLETLESYDINYPPYDGDFENDRAKALDILDQEK